MSSTKFLSRVRIAASPFSPAAWAKPALLLTAEFDRAVEFEDIWLAPVTVKGFVEDDLSELPATERQRLRDAVARFRTVADQVLPGTPATTDQVREALPAFVTILDVLKPLFADPEMMQVRGAIWNACEPHRDWVLTFDVDLRQDSDGDPAAWVWLILQDDIDVELRAIQHRIHEIRTAIWKGFEVTGVGLELYVSAWSRSEVPQVLAWEPV